MPKKKSGGGGGANWMDTYGDMVTLLLCFFVLLYSMSTISEDKWKAIVQSFNPGAITAMTDPSGKGGPYADPDIGDGTIGLTDPSELTQADIDDMMADLAQAISDWVADEGMESTIQVDLKGGKVYVRFRDTVMFRGDSYVLLPAGRDVLSKFCVFLDGSKDVIEEVRIQGHTAQAQANVRNPVEGDRRLAANRAAEVAIFIQENSTIHPARIADEGRGQWLPISSNATAESRAYNRRVEIIISGVDLEAEELNEAMSQFITMDDEDGGLHSTNGAD